MLDERRLRRPGFQGGRAIELRDGQEWTFPIPTLQMSPGRIAAGQVGQEVVTQFGDEFDGLMEEFRGAATGEDQSRLLFEIAVMLLERNYALTAQDLATLISWDLMGPIPESMEQVHLLVSGVGPRTYARWVRLGVLMAGFGSAQIRYEDAVAMATIQVALGRHIPADRWVDDLVAEREYMESQSLGAI